MSLKKLNDQELIASTKRALKVASDTELSDHRPKLVTAVARTPV
jgi:hypothetical protein